MKNATGETGMNKTWQVLSEGLSMPWATSPLTELGSKI